MGPGRSLEPVGNGWAQRNGRRPGTRRVTELGLHRTPISVSSPRFEAEIFLRKSQAPGMRTFSDAALPRGSRQVATLHDTRATRPNEKWQFTRRYDGRRRPAGTFGSGGCGSFQNSTGSTSTRYHSPGGPS
jgi:hypothetical protein